MLSIQSTALVPFVKPKNTRALPQATSFCSTLPRFASEQPTPPQGDAPRTINLADALQQLLQLAAQQSGQLGQAVSTLNAQQKQIWEQASIMHTQGIQIQQLMNGVAGLMQGAGFTPSTETLDNAEGDEVGAEDSGSPVTIAVSADQLEKPTASAGSKVPIPPPPSDEAVAAAIADMSPEDLKALQTPKKTEAPQKARVVKMSEEGLKGFRKKHMPDFMVNHKLAEALVAESYMALVPRPIILTGDPRDQLDVLKTLAQQVPAERLFSIQMKNASNPKDTALQGDVPAMYTAHYTYEGPAKAVPLGLLVNKQLEDNFDQPEGAITSDTKFLFITGNAEALAANLDQFPQIARRFPGYKLVISGIPFLPQGVSTLTLMDSSVMEAKAPTKDSALGMILADKSTYTEHLAHDYNVTIDDTCFDAIIDHLTEAGAGRPPLPDTVFNVLEKTVRLARMRTPIPEEIAADAKLLEAHPPLAITPADVKAPFGRLSQLLKQHASLAPPDASESGQLYKFLGKTDVKFDDVIGQPEAVKEMKRLVSMMKRYKLLKELKDETAVNIVPPKLTVLHGDPGTGKGFVIKAAADLGADSGVNVMSFSATTLVEKFVGTGAARVREAFQLATEKKPCIIFIDEIDAVARERSGDSGGAQEIENTLNELLVQINGVFALEGVSVVVATNRPELIDSAFDNRAKHIEFKKPNAQDRAKILEVHLKRSGMKVDYIPPTQATTAAEIALIKQDKLLTETRGLTGRQLEDLVNSVTARLADESEAVFAEFDDKPRAEVDLKAIAAKLPSITQALLLEELPKVISKSMEKERSRGGFGFDKMHGAGDAEDYPKAPTAA